MYTRSISAAEDYDANFFGLDSRLWMVLYMLCALLVLAMALIAVPSIVPRTFILMGMPPYLNKWNLALLQSVLEDYPLGLAGEIYLKDHNDPRVKGMFISQPVDEGVLLERLPTTGIIGEDTDITNVTTRPETINE